MTRTTSCDDQEKKMYYNNVFITCHHQLLKLASFWMPDEAFAMIQIHLSLARLNNRFPCDS
jgi:hypothetical protein